MRIDGMRADGALLVLLDGGLACVLRGSVASPAVDEAVARALGPWGEADSSLAARRTVERQLERSRTVPLHQLKAVPVVAEKAEPKADAADDAAPDLETLQDEADQLTEAALKQSDDAETADEHRAAAEALEAAAEAQSRIEQALEGEVGDVGAIPEIGTPEFEDYLNAEVARRLAGEAGVTLAQHMEFSTLAAALPGEMILKLKSTEDIEHRFTYCKEHVIPAMAAQGKAPSDEDAFCGWWKFNGPGSD